MEYNTLLLLDFLYNFQILLDPPDLPNQMVLVDPLPFGRYLVNPMGLYKSVVLIMPMMLIILVD
jgi:hypothetical protein